MIPGFSLTLRAAAHATFAVILTLAAGCAHVKAPAMMTVVAGQPSGLGYIDGSRDAARFGYPAGMGFDTDGNLYLADSRNNVIRRIDRNGIVATVAGNVNQAGSADGRGPLARFNSPADVAVDVAGNVYVADTANHIIRKMLPDGAVTTLAGAAGMAGSADGTTAEARFNEPTGIVPDRDGNLYVVDSGNSTIRKITPDGKVSTLAGSAGIAGYADGAGAAARFDHPTAIAIDRASNLYVTDGSNTVRKITSAGVVTTAAGGAGRRDEAGDAAGSARLSGPKGIAVDREGNIFVAEAYGNTIRKITPGGIVTTVAGSGRVGNADGAGANATFRALERLAIDTAGNLYVTDGSSAIRRVDTTGTVLTWAGATGSPGSADGPAAGALFNFPNGIAVDRAGNFYIADQDNGTIRKITADGRVSTVAGSAGVWGFADGTGAAARFGNPGGVAVGPDGTLYVSEFSIHTIRKMTPDGKVTTLAGVAHQLGNKDGQGADARFNGPNCVAVDQKGNIYVADYYNNSIRRISPSGSVVTVAGSGLPGADDGIGVSARFNGPNSIAIDKDGDLLITDSGNNTVRKMTPGGAVGTLAGSAGAPGSQDGIGSNARFSYPWGVAIDRKGNAYVADSGNNAVRKVTPAGVVTTLAGGDGPYANAPVTLPGRLAFPTGVAYDDAHSRVLVTIPDAVLAIPVQ